MFEITKDFHLSYSHQLEGLPDGHQCARLHGHNAVIRIHLAATELDPTGFVIDYGKLKQFGQYLDTTFDHRHLNDVVDFNPTSEHLARHLYNLARDTYGLTQTVAISWSETPKTWATYKPKEDN